MADTFIKQKMAKMEDKPHTGGDLGFMLLAVRNDTAAALAGTSGDYIPLTTDSAGRLHVATVGAGATDLGKAEDSVHASGDVGIQVLAVRKDTAAALAADGDYIPVSTDSLGRLRVAALPANSGTDIGDVDVTSIVPGVGVTNLGKTVDAVATGADVGVALLAVRDDTLTALTPVDGDYVQVRVDSTGCLHVIEPSASAIKTAVEVMDDWDETDRAKVNTIAGQVGIAANAGAMDALTTRVTVATDDTHMGAVGAASDVDGVLHGQQRYIGEATGAIQTAVEIMDDWDETDRAKVNPIVGQAGIAAGTGVDGATVSRVTLATDVPLPAGTNLLGKVGIDQTTPGTTDSVSVATGQGAGATIGTAADAAVVTDTTGTLSGKIRGLVKWVAERMPAALGQGTMAQSFPVVVASDQSAVPVSAASGAIAAGAIANGADVAEGSTTDAAASSTVAEDATARTGIGLWKGIKNILILAVAALNKLNSLTNAVEVVSTQIVKTVAATGTPEALAADGTYFRSAALVFKKAARTANVGNVFLGIGTTNDTQPFEYAPGDKIRIIADPGTKLDLNDYGLDVLNAGDGVIIIYS